MTPAGDLHLSTPAEHRRWRIPAFLFIAVVVLGSIALAAIQGPLLHAETIRVHGLDHLSRAEALRIAGIGSSTNVVTLDAQAAERRLEADPWVASATITKELPTTLDVNVREHTAVAVTTLNGVLRLVAEDGSLLDVANPATAYPRIVDADPSGPEPSAPLVSGAARALAAMPTVLQRQVAQVAILVDGELQVDLRSGAQISYGTPDELTDKAEALGALLRWAGAQGTPLRSADVGVPSAPTATFS